jgi:hypothetical protein
MLAAMKLHSAPIFEGEVNEQAEDGTWRKRKIGPTTVTHPEWARITVYKIVGGQRCPFPGPKILWKEIYSRIGKTSVPNEKWERSASFMLEKCTEAAALRKAFPEELGDVLTAEEMEGKTIDGEFATVEAKAAPENAPPRPTREATGGKETGTTSDKPASPPPPPPPPPAPPPHQFEWVDTYGDVKEVESSTFDAMFMEAINAMKSVSALEIAWENNSSQLDHLPKDRADNIRETYDARHKALSEAKVSPIAEMVKLINQVTNEKALDNLLKRNQRQIGELADGPHVQAYAELMQTIDARRETLRKAEADALGHGEEGNAAR